LSERNDVVPERPFTVVLRCATPARLAHLEALFTRAGYRAVAASASERASGGSTADAVVVDLVGVDDLDPESALVWSTQTENLAPTLVVVPESLADRLARLAPGTAVHVDVKGGEQVLLLRVALNCRRGRAVRTHLARLGVRLQSRTTSVSSRSGAFAVLTPVEFRLLRALVRAGGDTVPRTQLVRAAWQHRGAVPAATVDSHVRGVRKKLAAAGIPLRIQTVRGVGFACA
jgi:two-component system OmpR family response regulator